MCEHSNFLFCVLNVCCRLQVCRLHLAAPARLRSPRAPLSLVRLCIRRRRVALARWAGRSSCQLRLTACQLRLTATASCPRPRAVAVAAAVVLLLGCVRCSAEAAGARSSGLPLAASFRPPTSARALRASLHSLCVSLCLCVSLHSLCVSLCLGVFLHLLCLSLRF